MNINNDVKSWTVLIVDDEHDNLGVAEKVLSFQGARVFTAFDGIEGLEKLQKITPTFILLDLSMPRMDGWEMVKKLREDAATRSLPIIALTAHAMDGDKQRVADAGFNGYITKPYRLATFVSDIKKCLELMPVTQTG